jgi:hypothetical protein
VKFSVRLTVLQLSLVAWVTGFDVESDVSGHLWPPVIARYKFECFEVACMSSHVVLLDDVMPEISVFGDIDLTSKYE